MKSWYVYGLLDIGGGAALVRIEEAGFIPEMESGQETEVRTIEGWLRVEMNSFGLAEAFAVLYDDPPFTAPRTVLDQRRHISCKAVPADETKEVIKGI